MNLNHSLVDTLVDTLVHTVLTPEALGWVAALLTLLTFGCVDMLRLRLLALAANAAFIAYGTSAELLPVMVLHLALVPVNLWRLNQAMKGAAGSHAAVSTMAALPAVPALPAVQAVADQRTSGWIPKRPGARGKHGQGRACGALPQAATQGQGQGQGQEQGQEQGQGQGQGQGPTEATPSR